MENFSVPEKRLGISLSKPRGQLLIYRATIMELGNPKYIRLLYNDGRRLLAVQCCEKIDHESVKVPDVIGDDWVQFEINAPGFISVLYTKCEWEDDKTFTMTGKYYSEYRLVEFRLDDAAEIPSDQFSDPENKAALGFRQN